MFGSKTKLLYTVYRHYENNYSDNMREEGMGTKNPRKSEHADFLSFLLYA